MNKRPPPSERYPFDINPPLYSLTSEWAAGRYDLAGLLDAVDRAGIGPGIEIVASQTIRTYPEVIHEFVRTWREAFDRHGFAPSSFGANLRGPAPGPGHGPRRGVRVHRPAVPQRQGARLSAGYASRAPSPR